MLKRIVIAGYKTFRRAEASFEPLTVVVGANASGKSNLADLIGLLGSLSRAQSLRDAFAEHRGQPLEAFHAPRGFGEQGYEDLRLQGTVTLRVAVDIELPERTIARLNDELEAREQVVGAKVPYTRVTERRLRYEVALGMHVASGELYVVDESLTALRADFSPRKGRAPFIEKTTVAKQDRYVVRLERQGHPRYFDAAGRHRTLLSEVSDRVYHPHVVAAREELASWRTYYIEPAAARSVVAVQHAEEPGRSGELLAPYLAFLQHKQPLVFKGVEENLRQLVPGFAGLTVKQDRGEIELVMRSEDGGEFPARLWSEGTLRLLCILAIVVSPSPPSLVVYEEPENGVNPARLDLIAEVLKQAAHRALNPIQFVVTTHSDRFAEMAAPTLLCSRWTPARGTELEQLAWERGSLFHRRDLLRAVGG